MGEGCEDYISMLSDLKDCLVPVEILSGRRAQGFLFSRRFWDWTDLHPLAMRWNGICERAVDMCSRIAVSSQLRMEKPLPKANIKKLIA